MSFKKWSRALICILPLVLLTEPCQIGIYRRPTIDRSLVKVDTQPVCPEYGEPWRPDRYPRLGGEL
jgi:hypothetical protein